MQASSNVASRPSQLDINTEGDVYSKFGMPGDYVKQGKWPYGGLVIKRDRHDGRYGRGRYLVKNKGLVLGAIDDPLPKMAGGNETEQAIILAIAMQASTLSASSCFCEIPCKCMGCYAFTRCDIAGELNLQSCTFQHHL